MKRMAFIFFLLGGAVLLSSCQEKQGIFGIWALEANSPYVQSYLVLENLGENKVLVLVLNMKKKTLSSRYVGYRISASELSFIDALGTEWRIIQKTDGLEVKSREVLPEYNPSYYVRVKPEEGGW